MKKIHQLLIMGAAIAALSGCTQRESPNAEAAPFTAKQLKLVERELGGKKAGEALRCLPTYRQHNSIRVSDTMLIYRASGNLAYRNDLRGSCPGLARDTDVMVVRQFGANTCAGDFFHLVDRSSGIRGPTCVFGEFIPYRKE